MQIIQESRKGRLWIDLDRFSASPKNFKSKWVGETVYIGPESDKKILQLFALLLNSPSPFLKTVILLGLYSTIHHHGQLVIVKGMMAVTTPAEWP